MDDFSEFITRHADDDTSRLLLSRDRFPDIDMDLAANTIEVRRKIRKKVPSWYAVPGLIYPIKLGGEQCSSENTAMYKARTASGLFQGKFRIADLTGGLGVDSWAFSQSAETVLYNEADPALASAAERNFRTLGCRNIEVRSFRLTSRNHEAGMPDHAGAALDTVLSGFSPDLIFLDPARREENGKKIFLLEDCSPDILSLKDELLGKCRFTMVKLSPLADIGMVRKRLGEKCREIHIIASAGECKELLVLLDRDFSGECRLTAVSGGEGFCFTIKEEEAAEAAAASPEEIHEGAFLFEPGKALMKSGAFNLISTRSGMKKLGKSAHYYIAESPESLSAELRENGKLFPVIEAVPLDRKSVRDIGKRYHAAEVTSRNMKMDTETLRNKLGVRSGEDIHIFGLGCGSGSNAANMLVVTGKALR